MMTPESAVLNSVLICVVGAVATLVVSKSKVLAGLLALLTTAVTGVLMVPAALGVLANGPANPHHPQIMAQLSGQTMRFYIDGLSAIFLLLAVGIAILASLYSIAHLQKASNRGAAGYYPWLLLFVGGMYGVLSTTDLMLFFFLFWQLMTVPSFLLVRFESDKPQNRTAAVKYLVLMEAACAAVMLGAKALAAHGGHAEPGLAFDFDVLAEGIPALVAQNPNAVTMGLGLFLAGFGIKVGMWPFGQLWVPDAYSAAPSPVTSLISGVMSKTGVYGLLRSFLWLIPVEAQAECKLPTWGLALAILGTITLFTGNMNGLKQDDSKRLLAFSSISQLGYIILALGACVALVPTGDSKLIALASIGFMGALFHAINHGIFKGLLFFNAGSMFQATGTQDLNKMGGLWKYMPVTGLTVLIASFGIAGVPLLNGFVSKWAIYVATVQGAVSAKYLAPCAIIAILASALTLAMYIKFFGAAFLSRQSALVKAKAAKGELEVGITQQLPQLLLAGACVAIGLAPAWMFHMLAQVLNTSRQGLAVTLADAAPVAIAGGALDMASGTALYVPGVILAVLLLAFLIAYAISKAGGSQRRTGDAWLCGYVREADVYRYGASNFYGEIKRYFGWLGGNPRPPPAS